jgi:hypothetical protein
LAQYMAYFLEAELFFNIYSKDTSRSDR